MSINSINSINNYNEYKKITKKEKTDSVRSSDSVHISSEAMNMADTKRIMDIVKNAPDIRADKVAEAKAKLNDPNYINNTVLGNVADNILDIFDI